MSFNRVKQWITFSRVWYLFDAKWQDPHEAGKVISKYLLGKHKPVFSIASDCGDYVVVMNSKYIKLKNDTWKNFKFFHHTGYSRGARYTPAWEEHEKDPTKIIHACTKNEMPNKLYRNVAMARLLIYPDEKVPENILQNITEQIRGVSYVPIPLQDYSQEEINKFPRLYNLPKDFPIDEIKGSHAEEVPVVVDKKAKK